jgi:hypothetical protein
LVACLLACKRPDLTFLTKTVVQERVSPAEGFAIMQSSRPRRPATHGICHQRDDEQDNKHEEYNLRDGSRSRSNTTKSKHTCDQRYEKKNQRPVKHVILRFLVFYYLTYPGTRESIWTIPTSDSIQINVVLIREYARCATGSAAKQRAANNRTAGHRGAGGTDPGANSGARQTAFALCIAAGGNEQGGSEQCYKSVFHHRSFLLDLPRQRAIGGDRSIIVIHLNVIRSVKRLCGASKPP